MVAATIDLDNCIKHSTECKDAIAGLTFSSAYLTSGIVFTAMSAPGIGTFALQPVPAEIAYIKARKDIINQIASGLWQQLKNRTQEVVAQFSGLGHLTFKEEHDCGSVDGPDSYRPFKHRKVRVPKLSPDHSTNLMDLSTMKHRDHGYKHFLARILPDVPDRKATMLCLPAFEGKNYEYENLYIGKDVMHGRSKSVTAYFEDGVIVGHGPRVQQSYGAKKVIFHLNLVNQVLIVGSDKWANDFIIFKGDASILGGENTRNAFILTSNAFNGTIFGGKNATVVPMSGQRGSFPRLDLHHIGDPFNTTLPS